jgi:murein DD-endopeptidase MepM/ murein hydrolase activator NlpD
LKKQFLKKNKYKLKKPKVQYTEKKPFLADKEIIFRSAGRARVFNISHRLQIFALAFMAVVFCWSGYSYYFYHKTDRIISRKDRELGKTRDAYVDLMTDVAALQKNLKDVVQSLDEAGNGFDELNGYKEQALIVEDKIKKITDSESWIDGDELEDKLTVKDAIIKKDLVENENNQLKQRIMVLGTKIDELQKTVKGLEGAEIAILDKIAKLSGKEIEQIKDSLNKINSSLKEKNRYFNPLANIKKGEGGAYLPVEVENPELAKKMFETFNAIDMLTNYKDAFRNVPLGAPVYRYQLSSEFGTRSDPFKQHLAKHKGIDMRASLGSRVSAPADGKVISASYQNNGYGNIVEIDHGNGFSTKYAHLNKIYVKKGDQIKFNQAVGEVGHTGRATGNHLHYEMLYRGANVNPLTFVKLKSQNAI